MTRLGRSFELSAASKKIQALDMFSDVPRPLAVLKQAGRNVPPPGLRSSVLRYSDKSMSERVSE